MQQVLSLQLLQAVLHAADSSTVFAAGSARASAQEHAEVMLEVMQSTSISVCQVCSGAYHLTAKRHDRQ